MRKSLGVAMLWSALALAVGALMLNLVGMILKVPQFSQPEQAIVYGVFCSAMCACVLALVGALIEKIGKN